MNQLKIDRQTNDRGLKSLIKIASLTALALLYLWLALLPIDKTINLVPDDALFYFQVAKNFAYIGKITFDGVEPATGFHPGWMFLLFSIYKPLSLFVKFEPELFYRITLIVSLFFIVISIIFGLNWISRCFDISIFILPIFTAVLGLKFVWNIGLETEVLVALLVFHFITRLRAKPPFIALLSALITFFRIDMLAFFFILYLLSLALKAKRIGEYGQKSFLWDFLGSIFGFIVASFFYLIVSGYPLSTSMYLKSGFINNILAIKRNLSFFERFDFYMALASIFLFFAVPKDERRRLSPLCLYIFSLFLLLVFHIFSNRLCAPWYFKPFRYFLVLSFFVLSTVLWTRGTRSLHSLLVIVFMILPFVFSLKWIYMAVIGIYDGGETQVYRFSEKIRDKVIEPVFVRDYSGIVAFFSGKRVINGDGLINTRDFIRDYLLAGLVKDYIKESQIKNCVFSYSISEYKKYKDTRAIFEPACPFFLTCLPGGFYISTDNIIVEDCSERWQKCLVLVDCKDL